MTVKDAYTLSRGCIEEDNWKGWKLVWKMKTWESFRNLCVDHVAWKATDKLGEMEKKDDG